MEPSTQADELLKQLDNADVEVIGADPAVRLSVVQAARRLLARLETPSEQAWNLTTINASTYAALKTVMDLGVFEAWFESGEKEKTLKELVDMSKVQCNLALLRRLFRMLVCAHLVEEVGEDHYRSTAFSLALGQPSHEATGVILFGEYHTLGSLRNLPRFLAKTSYQEPKDPQSTNYMDATPERYDFWTRCQSDPKYQNSFMTAMIGLSSNLFDWTDIYDTTSLLRDYDPRSTLLVDVGGGHGHRLMHFVAKHPELPQGSLVLQDLPDVVAMAKFGDKVQVQPYDFFTPQPIQGSRAYFFGIVLHDWDDADAHRILTNVAAAMKKGYSKLLIFEVLLPRTDPILYHAFCDIAMMHLYSAAERTEAQWTTVLRSAGLGVVQVHTHPRSALSLIEAELIN